MTASTIDHLGFFPEPMTTPVLPPVANRDVPEADAERVRALFVADELHGDPCARAKIAEVLYRITGWDTFAYAALAASESTEEAAEHRQIARRRRPSWADEG